MSQFDPKMLGAVRSRGTRAATPERIFMEVTSYEIPAEGFHYAVGTRLDKPGETVRVRLNTVAERLQDKPKLTEGAVKSQYVSGENTRESIADKEKSNIRFIAFDDCRQIGENEYRAHWPKTMATQPEAEILMGQAHIRLRDASEFQGEYRKPQAYVELFKQCSEPTAENIDQLLTDALTIKDPQGRARDPLVILRVLHQGAVVSAPRMYPSLSSQKIFDQSLGEHKEVKRPLDADHSLSDLMGAKPGYNDFHNAQLDAVRALVAAIKGEPEPHFNSTDDAVHGRARNLYWGAKEGQLTVELISAEKIDFGADTRKVYLNDKNLPHLAAYALEEPKDDTSYRVVPGYTNTMLAVMRHENGEPYAIYASPIKLYPKTYKLSDLHLNVVAAAPEADLEEQRIPVMANDNSLVDDDPSPGM